MTTQHSAVLRVAVIGSGPAGIYTADALIRQAEIPVKVDVFDRLPTPYGLVRYGVAPDHTSIKSIARYLRTVLEHPAVRFHGCVEFGVDLRRDDLLRCYHAVVYATGAMRDRRVGVPGEDLPGSVAATDFVNWYCGHPDIDPDRFALDVPTVAVIGVGNVAVDVVRILARSPAELRATDIPDQALRALERSRVRDIYMIGRRGPAQAKFTTKELRELGEIDNADVVVDPAEVAVDAAVLAGASRQIRGNVEVLRDFAGRALKGRPRRIHLRFWRRPVAILGEGRVGALKLERTKLTTDGRVVGTQEYETVPVGMVLRSVGYQSVPLPDVPFDDRTFTVPNQAGRVVEDGRVRSGEYVSGWIKRGPTGVIGTNKSDAAETVRSLLADAGSLIEARPALADIADALAAASCPRVGYDDWLAIDAAEVALGQACGRPRVKIVGHDALLAAARR